MDALRHPAETRMDTAEWDGISRVLAVRLDNIGDVVLLSPALRAIKERCPEATITLLSSPSGASAAPLLPQIHDTISYRAEWQSIGGAVPLEPDRVRQLARSLSFGNFDIAVVFTSFSQSPYPPAMACYLAGIPRRVGMSKEFGGEILTHWVTPPDDSIHQADRNLMLLESAGVSASDTSLRLTVTPQARQAVDVLLRSHGVRAERIVVAAPGASCAARRYDRARFAEALRRLVADARTQVVLTGSSKERWVADMADEKGRIVSLVGLTSVPELAAVIERADVVIATNSAALHIADALRRPLVVLYGGADEPEQWRPRNAASVVLRRATECSPCHGFECVRDMECFDIEPADIAEHAARLLGSPKGRPAVDSAPLLSADPDVVAIR